MGIIKVNEKARRWCKKCGISNKDIKFFSGKLKNKYGRKLFFFNICMPCKLEQRRRQKRAYYLKHRREQIAAAARWNTLHRNHVRRVNRKRAYKKRMSKIELNLGAWKYAEVK